MRVKCVLCDKIESIENESLQAKRLRNRPIHTYMCKPCESRITEKHKKEQIPETLTSIEAKFRRKNGKSDEEHKKSRPKHHLGTAFLIPLDNSHTFQVHFESD